MPLEQINDEQMRILLDFADRCRHLCFGRQSSRSDVQSIAYREWKELSRDMNYAGPESCSKTGLQWKWYWTALKNRTKAKMAHAKRRSRFNGDQLRVNLTPYERRIIELSQFAANEPPKTGSDESTTDATDESQMEENMRRPESVVIKVAPPHATEQSSSNMRLAQRPEYRSPYNCQLQNSLVQPEMISIIQAEIIGMAQSQNAPCQNSPLNMSQYNTGQRMEYNQTLHDISDSIMNTTQSYTEISPHGFPQNASRSFVGSITENGQRIYVKENLQKKDATTQVSVPMDMNMHDFATSPINISGFEQANFMNGNNLSQGISEQRLECIRCLAQAISNLAEGTQAVARAQRMLATSYKAMANAQELMAASIQSCESWQTALATSNESIATALRGLKDTIN